MVICDEEGTKEYSWSKSNFYLVDKPCQKRNPGYPLDSISVMPENNQYWLELTDEENNYNNYHSPARRDRRSTDVLYGRRE